MTDLRQGNEDDSDDRFGVRDHEGEIAADLIIAAFRRRLRKLMSHDSDLDSVD